MSKPPVASTATGLPRPRWRGRIHTWAFWVSIPAVIALVVAADPDRARFGGLVFGLTLIGMFGVSASYHRIAKAERAQRLMRRLDHSMIFLLIAGTYTPICLLVLPARWSIPLLATVWGVAAIGIATKVWGTEALLRGSNLLYLAMGWLGVVTAPILIRSMSTTALTLLVAGGVLYTIGAVLFALRRPDPHPLIFGYHEIWHIFTVLAGASHFGTVAILVT